MSLLMPVSVMSSPVSGVEQAPAQAESQTVQRPPAVPQHFPIPAEWTTIRDSENGISISHPSFLRKAGHPGVLYAAAGSTPDETAVAVVINREKRERPVTEEELKESVNESLKGTVLIRKDFSSVSLGAHTAFAGEVLYEESGEKWFSLVVSLYASGYHYTIAVQASPFPDERLREDLRRAVFSFRLIEH